MLTAIVLSMLLGAISPAVPIHAETAFTEEDWEWLTYCNGTPGWMTWAGTYRGTWFDLEDFVPGSSNALLSEVELWFYHGASYPWDTSSAFIELWEGEGSGPAVMLDQQEQTALHMAPVYVCWDPPVQVPSDFWVLINTEMSAGGWPSVLCDNSENSEYHSFYSDDFIYWEPWYDGRNYFIAVLAEMDDLSPTSWGRIKQLF